MTIARDRAERRHDNATDQRNPFQRDRDRILYSSHFRRLAGVTQVVSASEGHIYHNRLTHSLKVGQVARRLAEKLQADHPGSEFRKNILDADVAEAAGLAHDLGHPPFGHVAEEELQSCMRNVDDTDNFEGNAQSFRIVCKLSLRAEEYDGLDLTRATLNAIQKYPWLHDFADEKAKRKWGTYQSEAKDFRFARSLGAGSPIPSCPESGGQSLEAAVMDWADDITYAVHDVEDHYRAGLIPLHLFTIEDSDEAGQFATWVRERWDQRHFRSDITANDIREILTTLLQYHFGASTPYAGGKTERIAIRAFASLLIGQYINSTAAEESQGDWSLHRDPTHDLQVDILKELAWRYVIERPSLASQQYGQRRIVRDVFEIYLDNMSSDRLAVLPASIRDALEVGAQDHTNERAWHGRLCCDAICGMTEEEIIRLHGRLTGTRLGTVMDPIR